MTTDTRVSDELPSEAEAFRAMLDMINGIIEIAENHGFGRGDDLQVWLAKNLPRRSSSIDVKLLEWGRDHVRKQWHGNVPYQTGPNYTVQDDGRWRVGDGPWVLDQSGDTERAKVACQSDFNARILSALSAPPLAVQDGDATDAVIGAACRKYNIGTPARLDEVMQGFRASQAIGAGDGEPVGYVSTTTMAYLKVGIASFACSIYAVPVSIHNIPLYTHPAGTVSVSDEPERYTIEHDGFTGTVIGRYTRLDGKRGVVMQQDGTNIVHVYGEKWLKSAALSLGGSKE